MDDEKPKMKMKCSHCGGEELFEAQDGHYFCEECHVQLENYVEMEYDEQFEEKKTGHRVKFSKNKADNNRARRLTSFEEYNHILIGLIDEILCIELVPNFKVTCLQLWISYLRKTEAAFFDKNHFTAPKLFATYRKADSEILYNKPTKQKAKTKKRKVAESDDMDGEGSQRRRQKMMRKSEKIISQQLSESLKSESFNSSMLANLSIETIISDHENIELDVEFSQAGLAARRKSRKRIMRAGAASLKKNDSKIFLHRLTRIERMHVLNGRTLVCILYCALNVCGSRIQLTDLLRFILEGRISLYNTRLHLPEDLTEMDIPLSHEEHHNYRLVTYESIRWDIVEFVAMIPDLPSSLMKPNLLELCNRYLTEMGLPLDLLESIERLMNFNPPNMAFNKRVGAFLPNYEGRSMAYIIFLLKLIFGIDGHREEEMSISARNVNETLSQIDNSRKVFVYRDWMEFIEYRQEILGRHYHPMLFNLDVKCEKPYVAFKSMMDALNQETRNVEQSKVVSRDQPRVVSKMNAEELLTKLKLNHKSANEENLREALPSSFSPLYDTFQHLLQDDSYEINQKLGSKDYSTTTCEYFLDPSKLVELCADADIEIATMKASFPKSYIFHNDSDLKPRMCKDNFNLSLDEMTEQDWRANLKKRHSAKAKIDRKEEVAYHEKNYKRVLEKRALWRLYICGQRMKEQERHSQEQNEDGSESTEPLTFHEETIFTGRDREFEEIDNDDIEKVSSMEAQIEEVFQASTRLAKIQDKESLTFVVPDYNFWHRQAHIREKEPYRYDHEIEALPKNFIWLLKFCASILRQAPALVYLQLLCIENQYVNVYAPVELMNNTMLLQKEELARKPKYLKFAKFPW